MHPIGILFYRSATVRTDDRFCLGCNSGLAAHRRIAVLSPALVYSSDHRPFSALLRNSRLAGTRFSRSNGIPLQASASDWRIDSIGRRHGPDVCIRTSIGTPKPVLRAELLVAAERRPDLFCARQSLQLSELLGLVSNHWNNCSSHMLES